MVLWVDRIYDVNGYAAFMSLRVVDDSSVCVCYAAFMSLRVVDGSSVCMGYVAFMSLRFVDGNVACYVLEIRGWRRLHICP